MPLRRRSFQGRDPQTIGVADISNSTFYTILYSICVDSPLDSFSFQLELSISKPEGYH